MNNSQIALEELFDTEEQAELLRSSIEKEILEYDTANFDYVSLYERSIRVSTKNFSIYIYHFSRSNSIEIPTKNCGSSFPTKEEFDELQTEQEYFKKLALQIQKDYFGERDE